MNAVIYIRFGEQAHYAPEREWRFLNSPLITYADAHYPTTDDEVAGSILAGEERPDVRVEFRRVILPQREMAEQMQKPATRVAWQDSIFRVIESREARDGESLTITCQREKAYSEDEFIFAALDDELATIGDDFVGLRESQLNPSRIQPNGRPTS